MHGERVSHTFVRHVGQPAVQGIPAAWRVGAQQRVASWWQSCRPQWLASDSACCPQTSWWLPSAAPPDSPPTCSALDGVDKLVDCLSTVCCAVQRYRFSLVGLYALLLLCSASPPEWPPRCRAALNGGGRHVGRLDTVCCAVNPDTPELSVLKCLVNCT